MLGALPHGEHGAVVRFLAGEGGLRSGYVAGGRGRAKRALLQPGNLVLLQLKAANDSQLATATLELLQSRALLAFEPEAAAILAYLTALLTTTLAEAVPQPRLAEALDGLLSGLAAGLDPLRARAGIVRLELLLLAESGFGLDLSCCALGGERDDLAFVSPKSGRAVSRAKAAGQAWQGQLLPLPEFLWRERAADEAALGAAARITGHFLHMHWPPRAIHADLRARALGSRGGTP